MVVETAANHYLKKRPPFLTLAHASSLSTASRPFFSRRTSASSSSSSVHRCWGWGGGGWGGRLSGWDRAATSPSIHQETDSTIPYIHPPVSIERLIRESIDRNTHEKHLFLGVCYQKNTPTYRSHHLRSWLPYTPRAA